ncbi:Dolichyl-phosphate-mannose-protein mannosyltransferase-domain-containing protein [Protomyces lactucae-debilis]|uniref:Dolichyl-phosphate-mannose--protein mannosyltransferase n=1 Tax=Protomyces lactucae-debilis TaxID=2754530 RepID=A0A1Y2FDE4_PROLT|nr:Dolichyl-phosphate-mannose-protein mannosyltransferase-domain-containing protein [Protomyces lactucae-debilis]ORY81948.1 Dolichyl-phosphate-mannose-protein mannosyltransferase-domain-containing protein [Protomyces lactucae-debilis]
MADVRYRGNKHKQPALVARDGPLDQKINAALNNRSTTQWRLAFAVIVALAFATRFYRIDFPSKVVFDEVHFGKFASYYLQRTYFFDVHPPLAKLALAFAGWVIGYDGHFHFDNIGDDYIVNKVPYIGLRAMPALLGSLTVPVVFLTMKESGYGLPACVVAASMVLFDNAHIAQDRLILLDAMLVFSMSCSIYCYVRFYRQRRHPFSKAWWTWLFLTGTALSCVMSTKYVGLFSYVTLGFAVAIDLWELLDVRKGLSMKQFLRHFYARALGLVIMPFLLYLFWFYVHFAILTRSGPGDEFMSPEFQETLSDNIMMAESYPINYFDTITLRHKDTKAYLHSHLNNYPLRYDDGRVSSQGQQVTGYPFNDTNNQWKIVPATPFEGGEVKGIPVKHSQAFKLIHTLTDTVLLTHDVASPLYATNQEFTTVSQELAAGERDADTHFQLQLVSGKNEQWRTKAGLCKLVHVPTKVNMWSDAAPLPDWGFKQQEINGNKKATDSGNIWYPESIVDLNDPARMVKAERKVKKLPFLTKYLETQRLMFYHNSMLTSSHPYASGPINWPFLLRGVSFWTKDDTKQQIYLVGNVFGWWLAIATLAVLSGVLAADQIALRRGQDVLPRMTRVRLYNSTGFFLLCWAAHYLPFFLMGRQLFLHHYLPAHLASSLVTGAMVQFIFSRIGRKQVSLFALDDKLVQQSPFKKDSKEDSTVSASVMVERDENSLLIWAVTGLLVIGLATAFVHFAPITYGLPGLTVPQALKRQVLSSWDMHYLKP